MVLKDGDGDAQETDALSASSSPPSPLLVDTNKRRRRARKPTYLARKEEKQTLLDEVEALRKQVQQLRQEKQAQAKLPRAADKQLTRAFHQQQLGVARLSSLLADYAIHQENPLYLPIRLTSNVDERKATLLAACEQKVAEARRFIAERFRMLNLSLPYENAEIGEDHDAILRSVVLDINHFSDGATVSNVYEALANFFSDIELHLWDHLGHVTMREDADEVYSDAVTQRRLVSATDSGTLLESNLVVFREYSTGDPSSPEPMFRGEHAVFAEQCVGSDDLYPYVPSERLRKDMTSAIVVVRLPPQQDHNDGYFDHNQDEAAKVVVLRWFFLRVHAGGSTISRELRRGFRRHRGRPGGLILQAIHEHLEANGKSE